MGETPLAAVTLLSVSGELTQFDGCVAPELCPGVIGNGLPDPAFIPKRAAARAGSSVTLGGKPFGRTLLFCTDCVGWEAAVVLFGEIAGNEPAGGHVGMVSNGEPVPADGSEPRNVFGIGAGVGFGPALSIGSGNRFETASGISLDWPFGSCPIVPLAGLRPSGIDCHGV